LEVPLTVLVNGSSASSSEILTGTLKDNKRAIIIGTQTFGKAVAYTGEQIKPLGELQITVMHYLTPSGYDLANKGIEPDLVIDRSRGGSIDEQLAAAVTVINQMANAKFSGPAGTPPAHNGDDDFGGIFGADDRHWLGRWTGWSVPGSLAWSQAAGA
jgi:C-terminal processing protease CtpA/Prc